MKHQKSHVLTVALLVALVASNGYWIFRIVDKSITDAYASQSSEATEEALKQALSILPIASRVDSTSDQVIEAAKMAAQSRYTFEKDGFIWVGRLGLRFSKTGRLVEAQSF